jgi:hypothetical protein
MASAAILISSRLQQPVTLPFVDWTERNRGPSSFLISPDLTVQFSDGVVVSSRLPHPAGLDQHCFPPWDPQIWWKSLKNWQSNYVHLFVFCFLKQCLICAVFFGSELLTLHKSVVTNNTWFFDWREKKGIEETEAWGRHLWVRRRARDVGDAC